MKFGGHDLISPVYVAPMAGVTDAPFRKIAREFGAGLACTEMISSEALIRSHRESFRLMDLSWDQRPVSVQLMGGDPAVMAQAARMAEEAGADIIDVNMGCPVPKVVKTSGGSSLLQDPDRACRVAEAMVTAVRVPVTVKIRLGWDFASRNYVEMATRHGGHRHPGPGGPRPDPLAEIRSVGRLAGHRRGESRGQDSGGRQR